jgi:hypothetical protein
MARPGLPHSTMRIHGKELEAELTHIRLRRPVRPSDGRHPPELSQPAGTGAPKCCLGIAGFFGSGKSHLQKMLGHLWANTELSGLQAGTRSGSGTPGSRARPSSSELDTLAAAQRQRPMLAASGAMPSGDRRMQYGPRSWRFCCKDARDFRRRFRKRGSVLWLQKRGHLSGCARFC